MCVAEGFLVEVVAVAGASFYGEGEAAAGTEGFGGGLEDGGEVAEVDEDVGGGEEVEGVGVIEEGGDEVTDTEAVVDASGFGFFDHGGGEVDAGESFGKG